MTPYHRMQAGLALVAISLVSLWALFATKHLQYHLFVAWAMSPASTVIHADKSPVGPWPLDLNTPATSQQLAALLYTLVSRDGDDPTRHCRLAVILPGDDAVNVTMVPLASMRAELRNALSCPTGRRSWCLWSACPAFPALSDSPRIRPAWCAGRFPQQL